MLTKEDRERAEILLLSAVHGGVSADMSALVKTLSEHASAVERRVRALEEAVAPIRDIDLGMMSNEHLRQITERVRAALASAPTAPASEVHHCEACPRAVSNPAVCNCPCVVCLPVVAPAPASEAARRCADCNNTGWRDHDCGDSTCGCDSEPCPCPTGRTLAHGKDPR